MKWKGELTHQIEVKRYQMVQAADVYGYCSKETLRYSQELDQLMNLYRFICEKGVAGPFFPIHQNISSSQLT